VQIDRTNITHLLNLESAANGLFIKACALQCGPNPRKLICRANV